MKIVIDWRWISVVDFNDRWKFFGRHQDLIFVENEASEIDAPFFSKEENNGKKTKRIFKFPFLKRRKCRENEPADYNGKQQWTA